MGEPFGDHEEVGGMEDQLGLRRLRQTCFFLDDVAVKKCLRGLGRHRELKDDYCVVIEGCCMSIEGCCDVVG